MERISVSCVYWLMRIAVSLLVLLVSAACGSYRSEQAGSAPLASGTPPSGAITRATPRPTTPATRDCTVSWAKSYATLDALVNDSELVVRAKAVSRDEVRLKAFAADDAVSLRSASRVTFAVLRTLSAGSPITEVRVVEDVCPGLDVVPGEEWLLFLRKADPRYATVTGDHYYTLGGPQGQVRLRASTVSGPFFTFQRAVHAYEGASQAELETDIAAIRPVDRAAARALVERHGWRVVDTGATTDALIPANRSAPFELAGRPFSELVTASRRIGLDLGATAPGSVRVVTFRLEGDRPSTERQYSAAVVYGGDQIVGAWVVAGVPWTWTIFGLDQRAEALAQ
jgi:hypothetical protein